MAFLGLRVGLGWGVLLCLHGCTVYYEGNKGVYGDPRETNTTQPSHGARECPIQPRNSAEVPFPHRQQAPACR